MRSGAVQLCYVNHHDKAYEWAARRRLEVHPKTGAAQMVEIRERVEKIIRPVYVDAQPTSEQPPGFVPLFADTPDVELLDYGVPPEWVEEVKLATEESLLELTDHLPVEAAEALLELATGGKPHGLVAVPALVDPFEHPDAQRRFRVMNNVEELERPRFPLGELDGLPSPRTAPAGRARFHGSRSCFWFGRHRQDGCSATPSRSSCAFEPRLAGPTHDFL